MPPSTDAEAQGALNPLMSGNNSNNNNINGGDTGAGAQESDSLLGPAELSRIADIRATEYIPPMRSRDPECVNVNELLANWLAPEVRGEG